MQAENNNSNKDQIQDNQRLNCMYMTRMIILYHAYTAFDQFIIRRYLRVKRIIHSIFRYRNPQQTISYSLSAAAPACQPIANRSPRDFLVSKTLLIISFRRLKLAVTCQPKCAHAKITDLQLYSALWNIPLKQVTKNLLIMF